MITLADIPMGSVLSILGSGADGKEETWYGQLNGKKDGKMEVALLQGREDGSYVFEKGGYTPHYFEVSCVQQYEPIVHLDRMKDHKSAWRAIGLSLSDEGEDEVFLPLEADCSSDDDSDYETASEGSVGSLAEFIVHDEEEGFTLASAEDAWVEETHRAVHDFNEWEPPQELRRVKTFIEKLEAKYVHKDDDAHFHKGSAPPDYSHPPVRKKAKYK